MDILFEFLIELLLEGCFEASKCRKIPKWLRYIFIAIIVFFFLGIIGLIFFLGIILLNKHLPVGIIIILLAIFMLIAGIIKFKQTYIETKRNQKP